MNTYPDSYIPDGGLVFFINHTVVHARCSPSHNYVLSLLRPYTRWSFKISRYVSLHHCTLEVTRRGSRQNKQYKAKRQILVELNLQTTPSFFSSHLKKSIISVMLFNLKLWGIIKKSFLLKPKRGINFVCFIEKLKKFHNGRRTTYN